MKNLLVLIFFTLFSVSAFCQQQVFVKKWDKRFGGDDVDWLIAIEQTFDAGFILGGHSLSGISGAKTEPSWGGRDFWVVKIDSLGNKEWDKSFGGTGSDALHVLQQTKEGGYVFVGSSTSGISGDRTEPSRGASDYWLVKTDSIGNKEWDKRYGSPSSDNLWALQQTSDGGYIMGGYTKGGIPKCLISATCQVGFISLK